MSRWRPLVLALAASLLGMTLGAVPVNAAESGVTISGFAPTVTGAGASVTITGSGFSDVPPENVVKVNGRTAEVQSATSTQLSILVPTGSTSGPIEVSSPSGYGTSATDLYVPPSPFVPADVEFTSRSPVGQETVATVSTSNKVALLTFAGEAGQRVGIRLSGTTFGTSVANVRVSVLRPDGSTLVVPTGSGDPGIFFDTRTLPTPAPTPSWSIPRARPPGRPGSGSACG